MHFDLVDAVLEQEGDRIVTVKQVTAAEEYLRDHFPGYPILPGVFMLESMVQAARRLLARPDGPRLVLGEVRALKYGSMVRPGDALVVTVEAGAEDEHGRVACRGRCLVRHSTAPGAPADSAADETAASGRFTMRPSRWSPVSAAG